MYQFHAKYFLITLPLLILTNGKIFAQTSTISNPLSTKENAPYSRFGVGEQWDGDNVQLRGMADLSSAFASPFTTNSDNPASYSFLAVTTYEAGALASFRNIASNAQNYGTGTATLSYLAFGVPIGKRAGLSFGVRPETHVYYSFTDTSNTAIGNNTIKSFNGAGGLNYAYVGAAYKINNLSLGFNFGYLFGQVNTSNNVDNTDTTSSLSSAFTQYNKIGGIYYKLGALYEGKLNKKLSLRVGGTLSLQQNLSETRDAYWIGSYSFPDTTVQDTTYTAAQQKGSIIMPLSYSLGVQVSGGNIWMLGIDYAATQWTQYRNFGFTDSLTNSYKLSIGGQITPNPSALHSYWSKVTYRAGFYYGTDNVYLQNTVLHFYGATIGTSLPFKRSADELHLALDVGSLGTQSNGLIRETYIRFSLGMSFDQIWFIKRRYD